MYISKFNHSISRFIFEQNGEYYDFISYEDPRYKLILSTEAVRMIGMDDDNESYRKMIFETDIEFTYSIGSHASCNAIETVKQFHTRTDTRNTKIQYSKISDIGEYCCSYFYFPITDNEKKEIENSPNTIKELNTIIKSNHLMGQEYLETSPIILINSDYLEPIVNTFLDLDFFYFFDGQPIDQNAVIEIVSPYSCEHCPIGWIWPGTNHALYSVSENLLNFAKLLVFCDNLDITYIR